MTYNKVVSLDSILNGNQSFYSPGRQSNSFYVDPEFNYNVSKVMNYSNKLKQTLEEINPMKEKLSVKVENEVVKVPLFGKLGEFFGLYKEVNEQVERKIVEKLGLEQSLPLILRDMRRLSSDLGDLTKEYTNMINSREDYIEEMYEEINCLIKSYNSVKLSMDVITKEILTYKEELSNLEQYLLKNDYKQKDYFKVEQDVVKIKKSILEKTNNYELSQREVFDKEQIKNRIETHMLRSVDENKYLKMYIKHSEKVRTLVDCQIRESSMSFIAVYATMQQLIDTAQVGSVLMSQGILNNSLSNTLIELTREKKTDERKSSIKLINLLSQRFNRKV